MADLFDFKPKPGRYAVMGNPIAHSKSPQIHTAFAQQCGQSISYTAIQVDVGGFAQALGNFQATGGHGVNVTVPFKHEAWELCEEHSVRAEQAKAVNTVLFKADGRRYGDNTDGVGLVRDLCVNHGAVMRGLRILLMGAGGAVRGVLGPLLGEQPATLIIANRNVDKARELVLDFANADILQASSYAALEGRQFDLIINGTAASLQGELPPLPAGIVARGAWCYDMMYGSAPTVFMRWAQQQGAEKIVDGLGMLVEQAAESFYLWRGVRPQTGPVIQSLRHALTPQA